MTQTPRLPDEAWCRRIRPALANEASIFPALKKIGRPLFLKLKEDSGDGFVIVRLAATEGDGLELDVHAEATVEEDGLIVSMTMDTWRRLLSGSLDLATGLMGRDVKAKGSMFELMRIADPAEQVIQAFAKVDKMEAA